MSKRAFLAWGVLTVLVLASLLGIWLWRGAGGFETAIQRGPFTNLPVTLASVAVTWLLAGLFLYLLSARKINKKNAWLWGGFFLVALVYLNLLRERPEYGDVEYYIAAALQARNNRPTPH
jgi:formate hydrogenlyase subunit 4